MHTRVVVVMVAAGLLAGAGFLASGGSAGAQAGPSHAAWTQTATCPGSGVTLTLTASNLRTVWHGAGAKRWSAFSGDVAVAAPGHPVVTYGESYRVHDTVPPGGGGTVVAGTSVQLTPGGGAYVVSGTAFLSPDGLLGRASGTAASVCAAFGA